MPQGNEAVKTQAEQVELELKAGWDLDVNANQDKKADGGAGEGSDSGGTIKHEDKKQEAEAKVAAETAEKKVETQEKKEDYEQKWRSLNGVVKSRDDRIKDLERQLSERKVQEVPKAQEDKGEKAKDAKQVEETVLERLRKSQKVKALETDYGPEFVEALADVVGLVSESYDKKFDELNVSSEARIKAIMDEVKPQLDRFSPVAEDYQVQIQEAHDEAVMEAHPKVSDYMDSVDADGKTVEGELTRWMSDHPLAEVWRKVFDSGTAAQINAMLDVFEKDTGKAVGAAASQEDGTREDNAKKQDDLEKMRGVKTKKGPIFTGGAKKTGTLEDGWNTEVRLN